MLRKTKLMVGSIVTLVDSCAADNEALCLPFGIRQFVNASISERDAHSRAFGAVNSDSVKNKGVHEEDTALLHRNWHSLIQQTREDLVLIHPRPTVVRYSN